MMLQGWAQAHQGHAEEGLPRSAEVSRTGAPQAHRGHSRIYWPYLGKPTNTAGTCKRA